MKSNKIKLIASFSLLIMAASLVQARIASRTFGGSARDSDEAKHEITAKALKAKLDKNEKVVIIDSRSHLNGQILKGAINIPVNKVGDWAESADKSSFIITYCTCPHDEAAEEEMHQLRAMGFANVFSLTGGLEAARSAGIEIVSLSE